MTHSPLPTERVDPPVDEETESVVFETRGGPRRCVGRRDRSWRRVATERRGEGDDSQGEEERGQASPDRRSPRVDSRSCFGSCRASSACPVRSPAREDREPNDLKRTMARSARAVKRVRISGALFCPRGLGERTTAPAMMAGWNCDRSTLERAIARSTGSSRGQLTVTSSPGNESIDLAGPGRLGPSEEPAPARRLGIVAAGASG